MNTTKKMTVLLMVATMVQAAGITAVFADDGYRSYDGSRTGTYGTRYQSDRERDGEHRSYIYPTPTPRPTSTPTPIPAPTPAPTKTWSMYNTYCAGCHGKSYQGKSASAIQSAINSFSAMSGLKSLNAAQITAIAAGQ